MTPEEEVIRAGKAREVLTNSAYTEAVREVEQFILEQLILTEDTDKDRFHALGLRLKHHHSLIRQLQVYMETGKLADLTLKERLKSAFK